jgi:hypothetical protein
MPVEDEVSGRTLRMTRGIDVVVGICVAILEVRSLVMVRVEGAWLAN